MSDLYLSDPPYALWSIWKQLSILQHSFIFALAALCIYCLLVSFSTIRNLRGIENPGSERKITSEERSLNLLRNRCTNLRRTIEAGFYLFGVVLFLHLQTVGSYVMGSAVEDKILASFRLNCAFGMNVIAILFVLHIFQWIVANRVNTSSERLLKRNSAIQLA